MMKMFDMGCEICVHSGAKKTLPLWKIDYRFMLVAICSNCHYFKTGNHSWLSYNSTHVAPYSVYGVIVTTGRCLDDNGASGGTSRSLRYLMIPSMLSR
jgi:hypothetical protein